MSKHSYCAYRPFGSPFNSVIVRPVTLHPPLSLRTSCPANHGARQITNVVCQMSVCLSVIRNSAFVSLSFTQSLVISFVSTFVQMLFRMSKNYNSFYTFEKRRRIG